MSRISRLQAMLLPVSVREALDQHLRQNAYGDLEAAGQLLGLAGHPISRSSIHRYATRLRASDAVDGVGTARVLMVNRMPKRPRGNGDRVADILADLNGLNALQAALLTELASLAPCSNIVPKSKK